MSSESQFTVPGNTAFQFVVNSAHRNPKYWPSCVASNGKQNDLDEFRPQRWLTAESGYASSETSNSVLQPISYSRGGEEARENLAEPLTGETSSILYRPFPGSYIPFSTGHRRCIGRRFAQVELLAVLAVLFKSYSLELDVSDIADGETVNGMTVEEKRRTWESEAARMKLLLRQGMRHHLTMQHTEGKVVLRLVRRGEERFVF